MAKLSNLPGLDDGPGGQRERDRQESLASLYLETLRELLDDATYEFAWATLESIRDQVEARRYISQGQIDAVENIKAGGDRHARAQEGWERHERRTGRRYDGWNGRNR